MYINSSDVDLDIMMNGAVLDKVVLKCETKEQEKMTVTFHDLKMPKHKVCVRKRMKRT